MPQGKLILISQQQAEKKFEAFLASYNAATRKVYRKAVEDSVKTIGRELIKLNGAASQGEVIDSVFFHLFRKWGKNFTQKERKTITEFVGKTYRFFRRDKSVFQGSNLDTIPNATFEVSDLRALEYYRRSDQLHLGKFITDKDTRKAVADFIVDEYVRGTTPIGNNAEALSKFKSRFEGVLNGEDWKIRRVIDTSLNRLRNQAALQYMHQAEIKEYEIVGIEDNRQSDFCKNISGRKFQVKAAADVINNISNSDPASVAAIAPFGVTLIKASDIPSTTTEALERLGLGLPPYHGHCRTRIVANI